MYRCMQNPYNSVQHTVVNTDARSVQLRTTYSRPYRCRIRTTPVQHTVARTDAGIPHSTVQKFCRGAAGSHLFIPLIPLRTSLRAPLACSWRTRLLSGDQVPRGSALIGLISSGSCPSDVLNWRIKVASTLLMVTMPSSSTPSRPVTAHHPAAVVQGPSSTCDGEG